MCDTPEIQYCLTDYGFKERLPRIRKGLFGGELKMFCTEGDWIVNVAMLGLSYHAIRTVRAVEGSAKLLWLPRQDQLQEMVEWKRLEQLQDTFIGFDNRQPWAGKADSTPPSMEQLWLAFVMKEKHDKTWDGDKWGNI